MTSPLDFEDFCEWCGGLIDRSKPHSVKRIYCCNACQIDHYRRIEKDARLEAKKDRPPCRQCGVSIPAAKNVRAAFCTIKCRNDWHNGRRPAAGRTPSGNEGSPLKTRYLQQ